MKIEKINKNEYEEQRKKSILEKGEYARLEIIIEPNDNLPIVNTQLSNCTSMEVARLITTMKATYKQLQKMYPKEAIMSEICFSTECLGVEETNRKEGDNENDKQ